MAQLELHGITKRFGRQIAVQNFDLTVGDGELVTFLGPSGCGKTTTLRITAGFEFPDEGSIVVNGRDITALPANRRGMGMVFQGYALFPNMSAADNIEYGLKVRNQPAEQRRRRVAEMLELFGLSHVARNYPSQLSGGQQQRTAFARAVAVEPSVLLLDEPLSAVDAKVREELRTEIRRMQLRLGITAILVTHDQAEALSISDRVVVMSQGRIEEIGTPSQIYAEPRSEFTASFIGAMNEVPVRIVSRADGLVERDGVRFEGPGAADLPDGSDALLLIRPESLEPIEASTVPVGPVIRGRVEVQTFLGSQTRLLVRQGSDVETSVHGSRLVAVDVPSATANRWPPGTEIAVAIPTRATRVIAARASEPSAVGADVGAGQRGR